MEAVLGARSFIAAIVTRLTIGVLLGRRRAYPVVLGLRPTWLFSNPRMAIPSDRCGKSLADDETWPRYCKLLSSLAGAIC